MNKQDQNYAIAWKCGLRGEGTPDYLNDLNAMHEAEKVLTDEQKREYRICLFRLCDCYAGREVHATAAQRAEAFLKTLNLWKP